MDGIIDVNTLFGPLPAASSDLTIEALTGLMQKHNISGACTLSTLGVLLDPNVGNAATRAACADSPALVPTATLNPATYLEGQGGNTLASQGFHLVRLFPERQHWPTDFAPLRILLSDLAVTGLPVMAGVAKAGDLTALARELEAYNGDVIFANADGSMLAEAVAVLKARPNFHVEISRLLAPGCLRLLVETVGPERILFGTGAPSQPIAGVLYALHHAGLSQEAARLILGDNARRLLRL